MPDDYEIALLGRKIADMQKQIDALQRGGRSVQLSSSSVHNSYIPFFDGEGVEAFRIGRMPDGSFTAASTTNTEPPSVPLAPIVTPIIGGLKVEVSDLSSDIKYDFGYIQVLVNDQRVGNIIKIPGSLIVSPLDVTKDHVVKLIAVNAGGVKSAPSAPVSAKPLSVVSGIDFAQITSTMIADDSITTPKLVARAVTALNIAASAVEADAIKSGSVTANKLEAILILANRIIAGDPNAARAEMSNAGFEQYSSTGQILVQLGAHPGNGQANIITIIDPTDNTEALLTLDADGKVSCSGLTVSGPVNINGQPLNEILDQMSRGIQCYGVLDNDSNATTSKIGVYELAFDAEPYRIYRFASSGFYIKKVGGGFGAGILQIRYTTDGSRPTTNSTLMADATTMDENLQSTTFNQVALMRSAGALGDRSGLGPSVETSGQVGAAPAHHHFYGANHDHTIGHVHDVGGGNHAHSVQLPQVSTKVEALKVFTTKCRVRVLYCLVSSYSGNIVLDDPDGDAGIQFYVEDCGPAVTATGGSSTGSGSSGGGEGNTTTVFSSTYTKFWQNNFSSNGADNDYLGQGRNPNGDVRVGMIGFDHAAIRSALANSSIVKVEVYLYAESWNNSTGGLAVIGTHNNSSAPTAYSFVSRGVAVQQLGRPEGKWVTLPNSVGTALRDNTIKGLVLDARGQGDMNDTKYAGNFAPFNTSGRRPVLRISYNK